ncbi:ABC transporter ATP-binding protein [Paraburkholderia fungorum]|uniref:ABC transporter ATP-binding protein n=1 Tax=Paraburkholderia fungorum TaxID=134537 RepID=UPI0038B9190A
METLIEFSRVSKRFGTHTAVDGLDLRVERGEIVALLGRTGAGKSTVMNLLMGTLAADSGTVTVAGVDPSRQFASLRGQLAVSFQTDRLLPWRTARENVELGLLLLDRSKKEARAIALEWLTRVGLAAAEKKYAHEMSGGMRQRVSLARALAVDPEIVLLDESFSQLDPVTSRELRHDFREIVKTYAKTCVFVTHNIDDALEIADRIFVLAAPARVACELTISEESRHDAIVTTRMRAEIERAIGSP